jgi:hypothetical protein
MTLFECGRSNMGTAGNCEKGFFRFGIYCCSARVREMSKHSHKPGSSIMFQGKVPVVYIKNIYIYIHMLSRLTKSKVKLGCYVQTHFGGFCFSMGLGGYEPVHGRDTLT